MKFEVNRDVLSEAVSFAVKLLPARSATPFVTGVLIETGESELVLSSFDYEVSTQTKIAAAITEPGKILVSGRLLAEIASRLPNAPVVFETEDSKINVSCGQAKFTLLAMPLEGYPSIPHLDGQTGVVPADDFSHAVAQVAMAASRDTVMPVISGVLFEVSGNTLSLVATDRYRVAIRDLPWDSNGEHNELSVLVPARTVQEIGKTFGSTGNISISVMSVDDKETISFTADNKTVTSLLIKGTFPPVRRLFPEVVENYIVVQTSDLVDATRRVKLVVDRDIPIRYTFDSAGITLEAMGGDKAQASEVVDAILTGTGTVVSLKPDLLLDGLTAVQSEFTRIGFTNGDNPGKPGPVLISPQTAQEGTPDNAFRYLLQPNLLLR